VSISATPHRNWFVVLVDIVGVGLFAVGMIAWALSFAIPFDAPFTAAAALLAALVAVDFGSGLFHWACDTWGSPSWPVVGRAFIAPFREHHHDQHAITRHGFLEVNGASCFIGAPIVGLAYATADNAQTGGSAFASVFFPAMALFLFTTNQIHKWSHMDRAPRVVRRLQAWGLVLSARHHAEHHGPPHDRCYCITLGWLNPMLDRIRFWRALERVIVWGTRGRAQPVRTLVVADGRASGGPWAGQPGHSRVASR
jgi:ubiquitin-conjugating enzyme E2 variant